MASPIITALVRVGVVGFQSLKGDITCMKDTEARLTEEIGKQREDLPALNDNLDRVLESSLAEQPRQSGASRSVQSPAPAPGPSCQNGIPPAWHYGPLVLPAQ